MQTLLRCLYSPGRVQSHASTFVRTLKIYKKNPLAAIPLFGHTKILHTLIGLGSAALAASVVPYTRVKPPEFHAGD